MKSIASAQDWLARRVTVDPAHRDGLLDSMLRRQGTDTVGYALQLAISMAIATLGLALGSAAVVIGAMLISPLMQPLVDLGVGLAIGSWLLTIRAAIRTAGSVIVVVVGAAGITQLLPFHEVNTELIARTSPTMLDLFVAGCCALAAVYTTVRQSADTISAAAGTAIGIALVPPLCTAGYGLGTGDHDMLRGALLLFTANFTAIVSVTAVCVLLLGFGQVDVGALERDVLEKPGGRGFSRAAARLSRRTVGARLGALARFVLPVLLLAAIYVPLERALSEVSWQIQVRSRVEDLLAARPETVVRQTLDVRGGVVRVRLFLIGSDADARRLRDQLQTEIDAVAGDASHVEVFAVPDASSLDAIASELRRPPTATPPPPPAAATFTRDLRAAVAALWPHDAAGRPLRVSVEIDNEGDQEAVRVSVTHLGAPLGASGEELLASALTARLEIEVGVHDDALSPEAVVAPPAELAGWLPRALELLARARGVTGIHICVGLPELPTAPPPPRGARRVAPAPDPALVALRAVLDAALAGRGEVTLVAATEWRIQLSVDPCPLP